MSPTEHVRLIAMQEGRCPDEAERSLAERPAQFEGSPDEPWIDTSLTELVPLPDQTSQVIVGTIGSQLTVLTTAGKVLWQRDVREIGARA